MGFLGSLLNIGAMVATGGASAIWRYAALAFMALSGGPEQVGPRLDNLTIDLDGDGQILQVGWGVWPIVSMRLVFTTGLIEHKKSKKKGGLFGTSIGATKITSFAYSTKCLAVGGKRRITRLKRLKLNEFVQYDWNGGDELGGELVWNGQFWEGDTRLKSGDTPTHICVYPGDIDQPVSAVIEEAKGVGEWTNYPGVHYVEISIPNMDKFGNAMPRIWAEFEYEETSLIAIIEEIGSWVGLEPTDFNLTALAGIQVAPIEGEGFVADQRKKANDYIADLMQLHHFSLPEIDGVLTAVLSGSAESFSFTSKQLQVTSGYEATGLPSTPLDQPNQHELTQVMEILFKDTGREGATGYRRAYRYQNEDNLPGTRKKTTIQTSASMGGSRASGVARVVLAEEWAGSLILEGYGGVEHLVRAAGDEGWVQTADGPKYMTIDSLKPPLFGPIQFNLVGLDPLVYGLPLRDDTAGIERKTPIEPGSPIVFVSEFPLAQVGSATNNLVSVVIAVCRSIRDNRWTGADIEIDVKKPGADWIKSDEDEWGSESVIGELTASWSPSSPEAGFTTNGFTCQIWNGGVTSVSRDVAAGGANVALFQNGLVALIQTADLTSTGSDSKFFSITSLQAGVFGSDDFLGEPLTAGMRFVMLTDETGEWLDGPYMNVVRGVLPTGTLLRVKVSEQEGDGNTVTFDLGEFKGENVRPPSPVIERAWRNSSGDFRLKGRARSRFYENNFVTDPGDTHFDEPQFGGLYKFRLTLEGDGFTSTFEKTTPADDATFDFVWTNSQLSELLEGTSGGITGSITGSIALVGYTGAGRTAAFEQISKEF